MVDLKSALRWVGTVKENVHLLRRWRFWQTRANSMHWKVGRAFSCQTTSWSKEKEDEGGKCLSFYRVKQRHLTAIDEAKWSNKIPGSFIISIIGNCISFSIFYYLSLSFYLLIIILFPTEFTRCPASQLEDNV